MRAILRVLAACAAVVACMALAAPAGAASKTVCASGCAFTEIQKAIDTVPAGFKITIGPGAYYENLVVHKPVTLQGSGNETVLYPGVSKPECEGGTLCGGEASTMILVEADNVTISGMRLQGDNPKLTSGVVRGGEDIDARNGIVTNHLAGVYQNLVVTKVKIVGVYLRGIYASSGGTFKFTLDTVENVQGDSSSIAMFNYGGAGVMANNKVLNANDAISANHSTGTEFKRNVITKSESGVHTDNNGDSGGSADVIQENTVRECKPNGYGIFVFVPYVSATVESNKVIGCAVGLAAFGGAVSGQGPTFSKNSVNGTGAQSSEATYGAYLTTDQLGFASGNLTATLSGNTIQHYDTGMFVTQTSPSPGQPAGGQATVTATPNNSFFSNGTGANGNPGTIVNAKDDWWGCSTGPNSGGRCNSAIGTVDYTPWLATKP